MNKDIKKNIQEAKDLNNDIIKIVERLEATTIKNLKFNVYDYIFLALASTSVGYLAYCAFVEIRVLLDMIQITT